MFGRPAEHGRGCHGVGNWLSCGCSWYWGRRNGKDIRETCKIIRQKNSGGSRKLLTLGSAGLTAWPSNLSFTEGASSTLEIAECLSLPWIQRTNSDKLPAYHMRKLPVAQMKNTLSAWIFYHIFIALHPNYLRISKAKVSIETVGGGPGWGGGGWEVRFTV